MPELAVDFVILLPKEISAMVIQANGRLKGKGATNIRLGRNGSLPHLSLAMGVISRDKIPQMHSLLSDIKTSFPSLMLSISKIVKDKNNVNSFVIENTNALQALHETIMEKTQPLLSYTVTKEMILGPKHKITENSLNWIASYREKSSYTNFEPHITIGFGDVTVNETFPITFQATQLALCHLGPYCTCQTILATA